MNEHGLFLAVPTYNGWMSCGTVSSILQATANQPIQLATGSSSILPDQFNRMWLAALQSDFPWWAMCHADIQAEPLWADKLIAIAEETGADVVSCVVPIKSDEGLFSTGLGQLNHPVHYRFTWADLAKLPETFDGADARIALEQNGHLCVNTGCWLARLGQPWNGKIHFCFRTGIDYEKGQTKVLPEDWDFSGQLTQLGVPYVATRAVRIKHFGETQWTNTGETQPVGRTVV